MPQLAALKVDMHRLPQCVIQNFDDLLVDERIVSGGFDRVRPCRAGQSEGHGAFVRRLLQRSDNFRIALRRTEAHHDVFRREGCCGATAGRAWTDPAPEERACRRSRDEQTLRRHAGRLLRRGRGRRREAVPPRRKRSDISWQASASRGASRAKKASHRRFRSSRRSSTSVASSTAGRHDIDP